MTHDEERAQRRLSSGPRSSDFERTPSASSRPELNRRAAASQDVLERGRCNSNAPELASPVHLPQRAARFPLIRSSRAVSQA